MINNRQNGRRRGRGNGGNNPRQGGGGQGRPDNGNRIDSRARGNANQLYEKYKNLARDAQMSGDRVNIEYYLQFADHYFRVLADQRGRLENDNQPRRQQPFDINGDDDDELMEGDPIRAGEQNGEANGNASAGDRAGDRDRDRDDRQQAQGSYRRDRPERNDRDGNDYREQNQRGTRNPNGNTGGNGNYNGSDQRPRRDREEVAGQHRSDPPINGESLEQRAEEVLEADAPAPRRRGRPRREDAPAAGPVSVDVASHDTAIADRLPPSLGIAAANDADDEPKPRRRTRRPAAEAPAAE